MSGTIECDEPVMLQVDASARQYDGRALRYTYTDGGIGVVECDGETDFSLGWTVDYLWFDNQSALVQVRR